MRGEKKRRAAGKERRAAGKERRESERMGEKAKAESRAKKM